MRPAAKHRRDVAQERHRAERASVPGRMMIDWAKMIGITPAELMRSGMKLFCPSRTRPRPITLRGICTGYLA
jgi:hypothetical protein